MELRAGKALQLQSTDPINRWISYNLEVQFADIHALANGRI